MNPGFLAALPAPLALLAQVSGAGSGFNVFQLFLESGLVAKAVLLLLAVLSVASWTVMINKYLHFQRVARHNQRFLSVFRRSARFSEINAVTGEHAASPLVGLFQAGYVEIDSQVKSQRQQAQAGQARPYQIQSLAGVERSLRRSSAVELQLLSRHTPILATTAAAAPFIGLFGTVWGIMLAFNDIGASGSASIVQVAPGIAESLVNTAAGLVAAIPALVGYNQIAHRLRTIRSEMEDFALEFLNLTERNFL